MLELVPVEPVDLPEGSPVLSSPDHDLVSPTRDDRTLGGQCFTELRHW